MCKQLLSENEVLARTGLSEDELRRAIAVQGFPAPMPLGPWRCGWVAREVDAWLAARAA